MDNKTEARLRDLSKSSIVGSDIAAAMATIDSLRVKNEAMHLVLSAVAVKARISEAELVEQLSLAEDAVIDGWNNGLMRGF